MFRRNKTGPDDEGQKGAAQPGGGTEARASEDDIKPLENAKPTPPLREGGATPSSAAAPAPAHATGSSTMTSPADSSGPTAPAQPAAGRGVTPGGSGLSRPTAPTAPSGPSAAAPSPSGSGSLSESSKAPRQLFVGREIEMAGEISTCDELVVEGRVEARVAEGKSLQIAECGEVKGNVTIDQADIAGLFEGELTVQGRLTVRSTGRIRGTVAYADLAVEAGGKIRGELRDIGDDESPKKAAAGKTAKAQGGLNIAAPADKETADAAAE